MKYKILENSSGSALEDEVNAFISKGWKPVGGNEESVGCVFLGMGQRIAVT